MSWTNIRNQGETLPLRGSATYGGSTRSAEEEEVARMIAERRRAEQEAKQRQQAEERAARLAAACRKPVPNLVDWADRNPPEDPLFPDLYAPVPSGTRSLRNGSEVTLHEWEMGWEDTFRAVQIELAERAEVGRRQAAGEGYAGVYRSFTSPFKGAGPLDEWLRWVAASFAEGARNLLEARNDAARRGAWVQTR